MRLSTEALAARAERAASGDQEAINAIQNAAARKQHSEKLYNAAASGDKEARRRLARSRKKARAWQKRRRVEEKAKRDAGDPEAIARHERQKEGWRRSRRNKRVRDLVASQDPGVVQQVRRQKSASSDSGMSGIEDDGR